MHLGKKQNKSDMEMYNKALNENAAKLCGSNIPIDPPSFEQNPELNRIRKLLLAFIGTDLVRKSF